HNGRKWATGVPDGLQDPLGKPVEGQHVGLEDDGQCRVAQRLDDSPARAIRGRQPERRAEPSLRLGLAQRLAIQFDEARGLTARGNAGDNFQPGLHAALLSSRETRFPTRAYPSNARVAALFYAIRLFRSGESGKFFGVCVSTSPRTERTKNSP